MARANMSPSPTLGMKSQPGSRKMSTSVTGKKSMSSQDVIGSRVPIKTSAPAEPLTLGRSTKGALK